jgi:GrpB-like predicted nucleotidyltransferase (UPF0157 family)
MRKATARLSSLSDGLFAHGSRIIASFDHPRRRSDPLTFRSAGSDWERRHLLFVAYLSANPARAAQYAQLKRELAQRFGSERVAYVDAKDDFIDETFGLRTTGQHAQGGFRSISTPSRHPLDLGS